MAENIDYKKEVVKPEEKVGLSVLKKFLIGGAIMIVIILGVFMWIGNNEEYLTKKIEDWRAERYEKALKKYSDEMRVKYMADKDGGKTPEETIELFITALKAGDIEKASKYYVLEKQGEKLEHFRKNILGEYGDLQKSVDFYSQIKEKGFKKCNPKGDGCTYEYVYTETATTTYNVAGTNQKIIVPAGEKTTESIDVGLNKLSGVWKIELP